MKHRGIALVAASSLLLLAACGGGTGASQSASESAVDGEAVTLTFQSLSDQEAAIAATKKIVDEWNAENPDTQVEIIPAGWDGIYDKLITQFNSGAAPDIIHYEAASIVPFARDGYLADLTDLLDPEFVKDVPEGVMGAVTVDDKVVAAPTELQSYMVFANKTLLDAAGVSIPTGDTMTWDELQEIAAATTKDGVYGLGWGLKSPTAAMMAMSPQFGGTWFTSTGTDAEISVSDGEAALPELVHKMAYDTKVLQPLSLTQSGSEVLASFYAGQVAMTVQGSYQATNIAADAPEGFEWVALPPLAGSTGADQAANPQTLSVNVDSPHVEQAAEFINWFVKAENLAAINKADSLIPASTSAQTKMGEELADQPAWKTILSSGQHLVSAPYLFVDLYAQWKETVATPAFQQYFANEIDADGLRSALSDGWAQIAK